MKRIFTVLLIMLTLLSVTAVFSFAEESEAEAGVVQNVFADVYKEILTHSDKILSAFAFIGSLIIAFAYKNRLLPLIRGSLNALSNTVTSLKEHSEKASASSNEGLAAATDMLTRAEDLLLKLCERLEAIEGELEKARSEESKNTVIKQIMESQIDMLYEIFMSSSIPLYQKEAVGERISAMKRAICAASEEKND